MYYKIKIMEIKCSYIGRRSNKIRVDGASSIIEARAAVMEFQGLPFEDITLDEGQLVTWPYEELQSPDWVDYYLFCEIGNEN